MVEQRGVQNSFTRDLSSLIFLAGGVPRISALVLGANPIAEPTLWPEPPGAGLDGSHSVVPRLDRPGSLRDLKTDSMGTRQFLTNGGAPLGRGPCGRRARSRRSDIPSMWRSGRDPGARRGRFLDRSDVLVSGLLNPAVLRPRQVSRTKLGDLVSPLRFWQGEHLR